MEVEKQTKLPTLAFMDAKIKIQNIQLALQQHTILAETDHAATEGSKKHILSHAHALTIIIADFPAVM